MFGRCKECSSTLLPGSYKPGAESGTFVCTQHRGKRSLRRRTEDRPSPDLICAGKRSEAEVVNAGEEEENGVLESHLSAGEETGQRTVDGVVTQVPPAQLKNETFLSMPSSVPSPQMPRKPPVPTKPPLLSQDKAHLQHGPLKETRPTPAPRRATDTTPPNSHPVPKPRGNVQNEGPGEPGSDIVNGKETQAWGGGNPSCWALWPHTGSKPN